MGLRPYKELMPMLQEHVDLENRLVHIPESKTLSGEGDMKTKGWYGGRARTRTVDLLRVN